MTFIGEFLVALIIALFLTWCYEVYKRNKQLKDIPGPLPIPFIGIKLPKTIYDINELFDSLIKKFGNTFKYYVGSTLTVATCDADLIQAILQSNHLTKSHLYDIARSWLGNGLLVSTGDKWRQRRKLINPTFHVSLLREFFEMFKESTDIIVSNLNEEADKGNVIYAIDFFSKFSLDVIGETSFGVKLNIQKGSNKSYIDSINFMTNIVHLRNLNIWKRSDLLYKLFAKENKQQEKALDILDNTAKDLIIKRRQENMTNENVNKSIEMLKNRKRSILIDVLLQHAELSNADIQEEINNFLFAGYDTVSTLLSFAVYELAANPDIQEKLYEEIKMHTENNIKNLTIEVLQKMSYLDQVIKETLRLRSPVGVIERKIERDAKFGKLNVLFCIFVGNGDIVYPGGTVFTILLYWLHNNSTYFTNPEKFNPERFAPENQAELHPFAFIPFSAGPRNCIGQKYAMLEAKTVLTRIVMEFTLLPVENSKIVLGTCGVIKSKYGHPIKLERRIQ